MSKIIWEKGENLFTVLQKIASQEESILELFLPEERLDLNLLDLKITKSYAEDLGKHITFKESGSKTRNLVEALGQKTEVEIPAPKKKFITPRKILAIPIIILILVGLLGAGAYGALLYLPNAQVDLKINPVPLVKTFDAFADPAIAEIDFEQNLLPGNWVEITKNKEDQVATTGTATVGEKAKINVKIINCYTSSGIDFEAGQKLISVSDSTIIFLLDAEVHVDGYLPPASCPSGNGTATAEKIGSAYNDATLFKLHTYDYPPISAERTSLNTEGSSKQVKVVTSSDKNSLLEQVKTELKNQATQEFKDRKDVVLDATALLEEILNQTFSAEVGAEAENLSLSMTIKYKTLGFSQESFEKLGRGVLKEAIPEGFELFPEDPEFGVVGASFEGEQRLKVLGKLSALVINVVNQEEIKNNLAGKTPEEAGNYLSGLENIESFEVRLWPRIPLLIKNLPRNPNRIKINLLKD